MLPSLAVENVSRRVAIEPPRVVLLKQLYSRVNDLGMLGVDVDEAGNTFDLLIHRVVTPYIDRSAMYGWLASISLN